MLTPDELRELIARWAAAYPSVNAAAHDLKKKLDEERFFSIGIVTATKRINGDVDGISYKEAYNIWAVLHDYDS